MNSPINKDEWISVTHRIPSLCCPRLGLPNGEIKSIRDLLWVFYEGYEIVQIRVA